MGWLDCKKVCVPFIYYYAGYFMSTRTSKHYRVFNQVFVCLPFLGCQAFPHTVMMVLIPRRTTLARIFLFILLFFIVKFIFFPAPSSHSKSRSRQIQRHNFIERATRPDRSLNVQRHPFLQSRMGRDERPDMFSNLIRNGVRDYWERFQVP